MTVNNTHTKKQAGSAVVEFPFVVIAMMIILWGFVAIYRLFSMQTQLDNVTYNLVNAISSTQLKPDQGKNGLPETLKGPLLVLAESYLPSSIAHGDIGLLLESRVFDIATSTWEYKRLYAGRNCKSAQPIERLTEMLVVGSGDPALDGRPSTLVQLTLCVETPFSYERLVLPKSLKSSSVVVGKHYG